MKKIHFITCVRLTAFHFCLVAKKTANRAGRYYFTMLFGERETNSKCDFRSSASLIKLLQLNEHILQT